MMLTGWKSGITLNFNRARKNALRLSFSIIATVVLCVGCPKNPGSSGGPSPAGSAAVNVLVKGTDCPVRNILLVAISVQNDFTSGATGQRYLKYSVKVVCHTDSGDVPIKGATLTISVPGTPFSKDVGPTDPNGDASGDTLSSGGLKGLPDNIGQNGEKADVTVVGENNQKYAVQSVPIQFVR